MNILITGCNGQLGNEILILERSNTQHRYFNTDIQEHAPGVANYSKLDITDKNAVQEFINANSIGGIINCAAYTAVDKAETDRDACVRLNTLAPVYLAEAINDAGGWIIHVSTDYVFDGTGHTPYVEDAQTCPNSVYGDTKLAGEMAVRSCAANHAIIRTAWLYSEFGKNFVKTMIALGQTKTELNVVADQIGTPTYALDLAKAIFRIIDHGIIPGTYHFSNEGAISWYDFTKAIHRIAGIATCDVKPIHTAEYPTPAKRPHYSVLDKTKIKATYGITIPYWEESLRRCIENGRLTEQSLRVKG